ncbi:MAG: 3-hydroxyanthranilate 3,4-dioxygenase [Phycisphaerae bacterium]
MAIGPAFNLKGWIEEHRHLLKPPVGNAIVWQDTDLMVMIVGGPNVRRDYHINPTEEFFYQLEGDISVKVRENGRSVNIPIRQGDVLLLPPLVPHSPQRPANTIGMVVERRRPEGQNDHIRWYCEKCGEIVHDAQFHLTNLATQIKPVIEEFFSSEELRKCSKCGTIMQA